jgi:hypothetical protein
MSRLRTAGLIRVSKPAVLRYFQDIGNFAFRARLRMMRRIHETILFYISGV